MFGPLLEQILNVPLHGAHKKKTFKLALGPRPYFVKMLQVLSYVQYKQIYPSNIKRIIYRHI